MTPKIIAHRGVTRNDQENTLPAFHQAFSEGADGLEIDVRLSKDEKPIIFHDEDTSRLFDKNVITDLKKRFPNKLVFQSFHTLQIERYGIKKILEFYKKGNSDGLSIDIRDLSNKTIDKLLEKKIDLIIWTLNSMERLKELSKKNIRAIITDEVKDFADFLKRKA